MKKKLKNSEQIKKIADFLDFMDSRKGKSKKKVIQKQEVLKYEAPNQGMEENRIEIHTLLSEELEVQKLDELAIEKTRQDEEKEKQKLTMNRNIMRMTYVFLGLFLLMIGYYVRFITVDSMDVINNTYNKRQDLLSDQTIRGKILSYDGQVLAYTEVDESGNETRVYPYGSIFSHVVGRFNKGKAGLESVENIHLLTSNENSIGKIVSELSGEKTKGDNVITTLDTGLQQVAYDALGNYKGAVVVMEPSTGKILAMVSKPDYDPNEIDSLWEVLVEDKNGDSALLNRATQGLYSPGSTFKIMTSLAYVIDNLIDDTYQYDCNGEITGNNMTIHCYNNKAHGELTLAESFAKSCNTSFAHIGTSLDVTKLKKLCDLFLFNQELPFDLSYSKSKFVLEESSGENEVMQTVIGQGKTQISPLHNALIVSTIANSGNLMKPYLVDRIENVNGTIVKKYLPKLYDTIITPGVASILGSFMEETVTSGTATSLNNNTYTVAGKTGSADHKEGEAAHAWFVGYAPVDHPEIVISVVVESVGTGGEYAVPIAKKIFDKYFEQ